MEDLVIATLPMAGLCLLGVGVGIFSAGLGLGGGVLMVPAFIAFVPNMDLHTAKGTSLLLVLLVALSGFPQVRRLQTLRPPWPIAVLLGTGAIAGSFLGAELTTRLPEPVLAAVFLLFLVYLVTRMLMAPVSPPQAKEGTLPILKCFLFGSLSGLSGSATGTGGGAVLAPLMLAAGILPPAQMVYAANLVIIMVGLAAMPAHLLAEPVFKGPWTFGHVSLSLTPVIFLAAQIGVRLGARLNKHMPAHWRQRALATVLVLVAVRMAMFLRG